MFLLNGISGFLVDDTAEIESLRFKRLCYTWANHSNGVLLFFEEPHASQNFYKAELGLKDRNTFILLNSTYPFIAFASSVQYFDIKFIDDSFFDEVDAYSNGFRILSAKALTERLILDEKTLTVLNENKLNKEDINQIFYWKPKAVGDVIFNFWD